VVERESEGVVLTINPHLQLKTPIVVHYDVECRRVKKSEEESKNVIEGVWNELKLWRYLYGGGWNLQFLGIFSDFLSHDGQKRFVFSSNGWIRI
jgi:hypothetical protein